MSCGGRFTVRISPNPVVFRQLYPGATSLTHASPPPPDPRFYTATMTLAIAEQQGGAGRLDSVQAHLVSREGVTTPVGSYDGACDFSNELTRGGDRTIPPNGRLEWCMARLATPDITREYTIRIAPRIIDALGNVVTPRESLAVVFQR